MKKEDKREIKRLLFSIALWSSFLIFATVFWYIPKHELANSMAFAYDNEYFYLEELNDGFQLTDVYPTSDATGLKQDAFLFQVVNNLTEDITYEVHFQNDISKLSNSEKALKNRLLRYQVIRNGEKSAISNLNTDGKIVVGTVLANSSDVYELRVWLDQEAGNEAQDKEFCGVVSINTISGE